MELLKEVGGAKTIGIAGHVHPDGDCVGSCLGLYGYLKKACPSAQITVFLEQPSEIFSFLKGYEEINTAFSDKGVSDVFIALDSGDLERLGAAKEYFLAAKKSICIDHHVSNQRFGDVSVLDVQASSTCEILFWLFEKQYMDVDIAKSLYTGIVHDTGVFRYTNMKKQSFAAVGELVEYGFDSSQIIDETFYQKTYVQNQILGRALLESILFMHGKCIASVVDMKMMGFYQVSSKDLDGIINQLRVTKGVECAIFLYETRSLEYKVSMRSNGIVNVAEIASYFGGGGHVRAAGCTMSGTYYDVLNNLSLHIESQLKEAETS
ncbi:MAG: bifunctional oligoribonuclease/PAP phosphatase NrnA [Lachnospiraceae bacterium]